MTLLDEDAARNVPVVFILYNRPNTTVLAWKAIEHWQPAQLFLIADGPKAGDPRDLELSQEARQIVENVKWPCDVRRLYSQTNLGCRQRVSSGLDQVFAEVESAIILEDDCLVQDDFFSFCATLLKRYADDTRFWGVSGTSYLNSASSEQETYFATRYASSWGWATWRRAWQKADLQMRFWPQWRKSKAWYQWVENTRERWYWNLLFDDCYKKRIDSWATPFLANQWYSKGLFLMSSHNLVSNVGFGRLGTHTRDPKDFMAARDIDSLSNGVGRGHLTPDSDREAKIFSIAFNGNKLRFPAALYNIPRLVLGQFYRWLRALK